MKSQVILVFLAFFLSSCSVSLTCALYNNTTSIIKILQTNLTGKETFEVMPGESIELIDWDYSEIQIIQNNLSWHYQKSMPYIPNFDDNYVESSSFGLFFPKSLVRVQLEQDGRLFLLRKNQKPPIDISAEQPKGYPLIPLR